MSRGNLRELPKRPAIKVKDGITGIFMHHLQQLLDGGSLEFVSLHSDRKVYPIGKLAGAFVGRGKCRIEIQAIKPPQAAHVGAQEGES